MPPIYRIAEVAVYSLLNFLPFLALALYPFRRCLRFSGRVTAALIVLVTLAQLLLGAWAAFAPGKSAGKISAISTILYAVFYFAAVKNFSLTQTVWASPNKENPTGTVYGEFSKNNYKVEGTGAWKQTYGSLSMFYTSKDAEDSVYVDRFDGNGQSYKPYKYNSATSLFYFYTSSSDSAASDNYCTFARLEEKSRDKFAKLLKAVSDYSSDAYGDDGFTQEKKLTANAGDPFETSSTVTAKVPKKAIVIKSVKIKKY